MSKTVTLNTRNMRAFPYVTESALDPVGLNPLSAATQKLICPAIPISNSNTETLYECQEIIHFKTTVSANTAPFSILLSTRSEVTESEPTPQHTPHEINLAYAERITSLEHEGLADDIELNENSEKDFWDFINTPAITRQAELVFIGEGNIRAIWKDGAGNFLGLHFLGNRQIIYVIFKQHPCQNDRMTDTDVESFHGILEKISQHNLEHLVSS